MTAAFIDRTINGNHTFACALTTRGGVCDCWPEDGGSTAPTADSVEHAAKRDGTTETVDEAQRGVRDG
jgi:hypothetical protein